MRYKGDKPVVVQPKYYEQQTQPERSRFTNDELLGFIAAFSTENGYAPSFREIAREIGCSTSTLHERLGRLRSRGRVSWVDGTARTLKVVA